MSYDEAQNEILKAFNIEQYPEELQEMFLMQFGGLLFKALILRGIEEIPPEATAGFEELTSTNPEPQDVFAYFEKHIPNFENIIADVVSELKNRSNEITHEFLEEIKEEA